LDGTWDASLEPWMSQLWTGCGHSACETIRKSSKSLMKEGTATAFEEKIHARLLLWWQWWNPFCHDMPLAGHNIGYQKGCIVWFWRKWERLLSWERRGESTEKKVKKRETVTIENQDRQWNKYFTINTVADYLASGVYCLPHIFLFNDWSEKGKLVERRYIVPVEEWEHCKIEKKVFKQRNKENKKGQIIRLINNVQ
jgi:hypothetical protein